MITTRFAPSPTGYLHLGHAFSALFARRHGQRMLLRVEDIDRGRCRPEFEVAILEDLAWLGVAWDGGMRRQSGHFAEYRAGLEALEGRGLLYPCFCTRADIAREITAAGHAPHGPDGPLYPGTCRHLAPSERATRLRAGEAHAWRLDLARALDGAPDLWFEDAVAGRMRADPALFGDVVLGRKDVPASYHLASVLDDALQGVTLVTRGVDLLPATHLHRLLQHLFSLPVPAYHHHPLLLDPSGRRYAKRDNAVTLRQMRAEGVSAAEVKERAGF